MEKLTLEEREYYSFVKTAFRKLAPIYDTVTLPILQVRDTVVDFTAAQGGARILDVATGTGAQALAFAKRGYAVTGIDLSDAMLRIARRKNRYENLAFEPGDAAQLSFESNVFDVACISFALHDMLPSIRMQVLKEMARVTGPGGMIVIVDYALPGSKFARELIYRFVTLYEGDYYREFIHSDFTGLLSRAGITIIKERSALFGAARIWKARLA